MKFKLVILWAICLQWPLPMWSSAVAAEEITKTSQSNDQNREYCGKPGYTELLYSLKPQLEKVPRHILDRVNHGVTAYQSGNKSINKAASAGWLTHNWDGDALDAVQEIDLGMKHAPRMPCRHLVFTGSRQLNKTKYVVGGFSFYSGYIGASFSLAVAESFAMGGHNDKSLIQIIRIDKGSRALIPNAIQTFLDSKLEFAGEQEVIFPHHMCFYIVKRAWIPEYKLEVIYTVPTWVAPSQSWCHATIIDTTTGINRLDYEHQTPEIEGEFQSIVKQIKLILDIRFKDSRSQNSIR